MCATVRNEVAKLCLWAVLKNCLQDDVREVDFLANSVYTYYCVAFCDMRRAGVCDLYGRHNTLKACQCCRVLLSRQAQHFVRAYCPKSWQAQHFVTSRKVQFRVVESRVVEPS